MSINSVATQAIILHSQRRAFAVELFKFRALGVFINMHPLPQSGRIQRGSAHRHANLPTSRASSFGGIANPAINTHLLSDSSIGDPIGRGRGMGMARGGRFEAGKRHEAAGIEMDVADSVGRETDARRMDFPTSSRSRGTAVRGRGRGQRGNEGQPGYAERIDALGRTLTKILRHQALDLGLKIRDDGFVKVMELLELPMKTRAGVPLRSHKIDDVQEAVKQDNKQRLGLMKEEQTWWIRANQGHSLEMIDSEKLSKPISNAEDFPVCVHGTYKRNLSSILKEGLKRMNRVHVHFATGLPGESGVISGMRRTCEILIYLNLAKALEDNMKLYISENGVILTEGFDGVVPPKYFSRIIEWPKGTEIQVPIS